MAAEQIVAVELKRTRLTIKSTRKQNNGQRSAKNRQKETSSFTKELRTKSRLHSLRTDKQDGEGDFKNP